MVTQAGKKVRARAKSLLVTWTLCALIVLGLLYFACDKFGLWEVLLTITFPLTLLLLTAVIANSNLEATQRATERFETFCEKHPFLTAFISVPLFFLSYFIGRTFSPVPEGDVSLVLILIPVLTISLVQALINKYAKPVVESDKTSAWFLESADMEQVIETFTASLFAEDVIGEPIFLTCSDGTTTKIVDENFPIPGKKRQVFSTHKGQQQSFLQLSLCEQGQRVAVEFVIDNVQRLPGSEKFITLLIRVDANKNISFFVKKPLTISRTEERKSESV